MKLLLFCIFCFIWLSAVATEGESTRLLRFPSIHGERVVFTYGGNLYTASTEGGVARKLTSDPGFEMFARFSPDGSKIAFTAQYDGNTEVYVMDANGGVPKRLTHSATLSRDCISDRMGPNNIVMTWTPDGKHIIYRSRKRSFNDFIGQLYKVSVDGGLSEPLPLSTGGFCSFSPDGKQLAFNRVFREFRTWKYYRGGMADDLWLYDFTTGQSRRLFEHWSQDIFPMWYGNYIYFTSDRYRTMNLFSLNTATGEVKKLTDYTLYDIKFPSLGDGRIIYENGGFLHIYNIAEGMAKQIDILIADDQPAVRPQLIDATPYIGTVTVSPDGARLLLSARGDIFTVPGKSGITRNLTQSSDAHDRAPVWSPNGQWIAFLSDRTGEYEIFIQKQDGSEPAIQLTTRADTYKFSLRWSPDSRKILWNDKKLRLQYIDIETRKTTLVARSDVWEFSSFDWSPDSRWIAYANPQPYGMSNIVLFDTQTGSHTNITDTWFSSWNPSFSEDGKFLLFTSARDFNPIYSATEWNHAYVDMNRIYLVTLAKETPSPFAPKNYEVTIKQPEPEETGKNETRRERRGKNQPDPQPDEAKVVVDLDGIADRIVGLPVEASNYFGLWSNNNKVYYIENSAVDQGSRLKMFDLDTEKETELGKDLGFEISADGKKMVVRRDKQYAIIDLPVAKINLETFVDLTRVKVNVNPQEEWEQIYHEAWRQMRDFFYVANMHGVDWDAMRDKYSVLLPYANNRHDLNYLIGEMIGELNVGHAYISGGDIPDLQRIDQGLLGAILKRDASGFYRIDSILQGANWSETLRSPLTEIGLNISEGNFIIAVNGRPTNQMNDIYAALVNTAGEKVELTINTKPEVNGSRDVIVTPIRDEAQLYYFNWVQENIRRVSEATGGQIGYIHIPDMGPEGLNQFVKHFYPQLIKKGLIIDNRGNGGGNVSPMILERLQREVQRANIARNVTRPSHTPGQMMLGPKVMLIDLYSASDGDLFPFGFRRYELGTIIGVRTWGGVVGIRGPLPFVDGTDLRRPEFASYSADESEWIIEGIGVDPDIWIDNDPAREFKGIDAQLDKAIEVILEKLKDFRALPPIPEPPDKSR